MINRTRKLRQDVQRLLREDYNERKSQLVTLPERIATERSRLTAIRSSSAESMMSHGGPAGDGKWCVRGGGGE